MSTRNKPPPGKKRNGHDPNQTEFGIIWQLLEYPFRLRAGDVIKINDRLCRVLAGNAGNRSRRRALQ